MIQRDEIYDGDRDFTKASYGDYDGDGDIVGYAETVWGIVLRLFLINPTWTESLILLTDPSTWYVHPGDCKEGDGYTGPMRADRCFGPESGYYCGYALCIGIG